MRPRMLLFITFYCRHKPIYLWFVLFAVVTCVVESGLENADVSHSSNALG